MDARPASHIGSSTLPTLDDAMDLIFTQVESSEEFDTYLTEARAKVRQMKGYLYRRVLRSRIAVDEKIEWCDRFASAVDLIAGRGNLYQATLDTDACSIRNGCSIVIHYSSVRRSRRRTFGEIVELMGLVASLIRDGKAIPHPCEGGVEWFEEIMRRHRRV